MKRKTMNEKMGSRILTLLIVHCSLLIAVSSCDNPLIFRIVEPKTVTFESNGGNRIENQTVFKDQPIKRPSNPSRSGFTFEAWYSDNATFLTEWDFALIPTGDITLYAKWKAVIGPSVETFTVAFNKNGGDTDARPASRTVESGGPVTAPETEPTRAGFVFTGWYKEPDCINVWNFGTDTVTAHIILFAKWEALPGVETFEVTFDKNGGDTEAQPHRQDAAPGDYITAPTAPTRAGYTFAGWYKEPGCIGEWNFATDTVTDNISLYAKWEIETFNAAFNKNGGDTDAQPANRTVESGGLITTPETEPTRVNFVFAGWYKEPDCINVWNFGTDTVTADIMLYAKWEPAVTLITTVTITVTGPVRDEIPDATASGGAINGGGNFSIGKVSWNPYDNPFKGGIAYTASVTLAADEHYAFAPELTAATINGNAAAVTDNTGDTLTLSYTFAETDARKVTGMVIKTQPSNLSYIHTDRLDLSGLVVTLTYDDGMIEDIAHNALASRNISANPAHNQMLSHSAHDDRPVVVSYGSLALTTDDNLTVDPKVITLDQNSITIPARTYTGSALEPTVTVKDGTITLIPNDEYTVVYANNVDAGTATVTITGVGNYAGSSGSADFTINKADPVVTRPTGLTATYGQTLADISLTSYTNIGGTAGSFSWTAGGTTSVGNAGTQAHSMTFTPDDAANYNNLTQNVDVAVAKAAGAPVAAPTGAANIGVTSVTLNAISILPATGQTVEYARSATPTAPASGWQTGLIFNGLTGGTSYYFFARSAANANYEAGAASTGTAVTTMQNIGITLTVEELLDQAPDFNSNITLSRTGTNKTTTVAVTGTYYSINWEIFGPGGSVTGTGSPITLDATNVVYNSPGWHTVTVTVKLTAAGMEYQTSFRFRIVE